MDVACDRHASERRHLVVLLRARPGADVPACFGRESAALGITSTAPDPPAIGCWNPAEWCPAASLGGIRDTCLLAAGWNHPALKALLSGGVCPQESIAFHKIGSTPWALQREEPCKLDVRPPVVFAERAMRRRRTKWSA